MLKRHTKTVGGGVLAALLWLCGAPSGTVPVLAGAGQEDAFVPVTDAMLRDPDPADWLMVHRTYDFQGFSPLDQINRGNVAQLQLAWMRAMDEGPQEIRPLVYDGVMYIAHPDGDHLQALDATTGDLIWDYERDLPADLRQYAQLGGRTRHVAIHGRHIYHLTADAHLVALDARTGEQDWESRLADYRDGITHSSGAMVINGMVVSGRTCSPASLEARCFIAAHDAETGAERWRTYTAMLISENRWRAMRYSFDEGLIDFAKGAIVPFEDLLEEVLDLTADDAEALGCKSELADIRDILNRGTSAHRQLKAHELAIAAGKSADEALVSVVDTLIEDTAEGL